MAKTMPDSRSHAAGCSAAGLVSALLPLLLFTALWLVWPEVIRGREFVIQWPWMPALDLHLRFRLDGLGLLFGLIITGAGFFVTAYASSYMHGHPHTGRFFFFLHAFMISMLGIVIADNLLLLFVFWELTTVFSYLLIGFDHPSGTARDNARQALLVTGAGGAALLIGIVLLKAAGGSLTLSHWVNGGDAIRRHGLYPFILAAVLLGAFTKSAQVPFHFWLPSAMSAPTPISAFLHAATMVKAGIYLLMRFHPLLGGTPFWMSTLVVVGGVTALSGALQALGQTDLKRVLAFTTVMALGVLTMFLGGQTTPTLTASATFLLVHALYKAALFLTVGSIDHQTGTRRLDRLGGLWRVMPLTGLAVAAATMSMAGFPLFFGFIGKEIMYQGALTEEMFRPFATTAVLLANSLMAAVAGIILLGPFFGRRPPEMGSVCEAPWTMRLGPAVMGLLGIVFGLIPDWIGTNLIEPAVHAIHPVDDKIDMALFHGFNAPLLLSIITLILGGLIYFLRGPARAAVAAAIDRLPVTADRVYQGSLDRFLKAAGNLTATLQNGSLHRYLVVIAASMIAAVGWPWAGCVREALRLPSAGDQVGAMGLVVFIAAATAAVLGAKRRLGAIASLGAVGAGVAMLFLVFGAPDLALTQLLVETLTVIIVSLVLLKLPPMETARQRSRRRRSVDAAVALCVGLLIASLLMGIVELPLDRGLTAFFEAKSYSAAHGRNIVNVILVDFRSLDTLGEITVVVLAAWAAAALIRSRKASAAKDQPIQSVILRTTTRLMVGLILMFAVYLLLIGHHRPGGGFAGALVAGTAFALFAMAEGPGRVRRAIRLRPSIIAATGLGAAAAAGMPAVLLQQPLLTGIWWQIATNLSVGTPLIFDIGVFLAVLGAILTVLLALEED
jgi:multicomponent Na+:H+ antiporter subunit A